MRALLNTVLERMHSEKVPFTFLMPAAEAIYRPYDFRYIYDQCMQEVKKDETADDRNRESEPQKEGTLEFQMRGLWDAEEMADFFEEHFFGFVASICSARYSLLSDDDIGAAK